MVYIKSWTEYQTEAEKLYEEQPTRTRYCVKYRARDGALTLKVTDDHRCLKYKTQSSIMLNRFEAFNLSMMSKMQNRRSQAQAQAATPMISVAVSAKAVPAHSGGQEVVMADASPSTVQGAGGASGTGAPAAAKKKKPKKKK